MLHLVLLDGMVQLSLAFVLVGGLFLRKFDHDEALSYSVQLVFKHDDALKVHLCTAYGILHIKGIGPAGNDHLKFRVVISGFVNGKKVWVKQSKQSFADFPAFNFVFLFDELNWLNELFQIKWLLTDMEERFPLFDGVEASIDD